MKGYIYVYDQRSAYLKKLFLENGVEIVDSIEDEADFYFVKDQKLSRKNVFSLVSLNQNYHFRHLNNMLTAIGLSERRPSDKRQYIECLCDCGNKVRVLPYLFKNHKVKSCGCLLKNSPAYIDGRTKNPLYGLWKNMIGRCESPNHPKYYQYGKRGITVCEEWHDFWKFVEWSESIGGRPENYTLDRIDNNGNYEPNNCRWATSGEQAINKSNNLNIEYNGETKTLKEWSDLLGISWDVLHNRLRKGWTVERAFTEKVYK